MVCPNSGRSENCWPMSASGEARGTSKPGSPFVCPMNELNSIRMNGADRMIATIPTATRLRRLSRNRYPSRDASQNTASSKAGSAPATRVKLEPSAAQRTIPDSTRPQIGIHLLLRYDSDTHSARKVASRAAATAWPGWASITRENGTIDRAGMPTASQVSGSASRNARRAT